MAVASGMPCTYRVFLVTEGVARDLAKAYPTKDALCRAVEEAARIPLGQRAFANYWGNPGSAFDPARYPLRAHERRIASQEGPCSGLPRRGVPKCGAARRSPDAAVSRRSSARRRGGRLRLLPLAIPSASGLRLALLPAFRNRSSPMPCLLAGDGPARRASGSSGYRAAASA